MLGLFICYIIGFIAGSCTYKIKMTKRNNYVPYNDIDLNNPYATSGSDPLSNNGSANPIHKFTDRNVNIMNLIRMYRIIITRSNNK